MLIAQITDIHIGFDPGNPHELNRQRLDAVLARWAENSVQPDVILATGDLTDLGDDESYARLAAILSATGVPVLACVGNHDDRAAFARHFPGFTDPSGFVHYERDIGPLRFIIIDTLEPGRHGGAFCESRAAWLKLRLAERRNVPTYIVMHHPPIDSGIAWMTTDAGEEWVARFSDAISDAPQLLGLICGHLHRSFAAQWQGLTIGVCASTAPQVALDLSPIDAAVPDNRPMIVAESPAYALHHWNGAQLVSFFESAGPQDKLAVFDVRLQSLVTDLLAERPQ